MATNDKTANNGDTSKPADDKKQQQQRKRPEQLAAEKQQQELEESRRKKFYPEDMTTGDREFVESAKQDKAWTHESKAKWGEDGPTFAEHLDAFKANNPDHPGSPANKAAQEAE
jgi:hypothetical protein